MVLLRRPILVGAVPRVMVFQESDGALLPGMSIGGVARETDPVSKTIQGEVVALVILEGELGREVEDAARRARISGFHGGIPHPSALLRLLVPVVFAHRKRGLRPFVVEPYPPGVVSVDHIVAPAAVSSRFQL